MKNIDFFINARIENFKMHVFQCAVFIDFSALIFDFSKYV